MENFNAKRFVQTLKWSALDSKKEITTNLSILFAFFLVPMLLNIVFGFENPASVRAESLKITNSFITLGFTFYITFGGCWIFNNMKTKQQRITFKMLPASDLEKFLARLFYVTVFWTLSALVVYVVADLVRMLICLITYQDYIFSSTAMIFDEISSSLDSITFQQDKINGLLFFFVSSLWQHSFFTLGGTVFRRKPLAFAMLTAMFIMMVGFFVGFYALTFYDLDLIKQNVANMVNVLLAIGFAWALFHYWLSYRIFRRMQVINNKWLNL